MLSLGPHHYFAIVDDRHDVKDPLTVVRVFADVGAGGVRELTREVVWVPTTLLDRIDRGEVGYRAEPINEKQALRIRERWEKKISYRYSVVVREDDPAGEPVGVIREWDAAAGDLVYEERYVGRNVQQWLPSSRRWEIEEGRGSSRRLVACDAATVNQFISSLRGR
ncbi:hypothetical protein [Actinoplanes sp. NPDC049599]|uniref:hypothetical protein n=1 Tax=Actinoplanes sp. NPDC049599 TaxID=3363903 RepID=UPI00379A605A